MIITGKEKGIVPKKAGKETHNNKKNSTKIKSENPPHMSSQQISTQEENVAEIPHPMFAAADEVTSQAVSIGTEPSLTFCPVSAAYEEIVKWKKNLFDLPKGNLGKKFIEELTKQLNNWTSTNENKCLQLAMIMPSLLLQRTAKSCKGRINKENLRRRLELWESGRISELVEEGKCLQSRLPMVSGVWKSRH